mgnify:CR=1 FL=1
MNNRDIYVHCRSIDIAKMPHIDKKSKQPAKFSRHLSRYRVLLFILCTQLHQVGTMTYIFNHLPNIVYHFESIFADTGLLAWMTLVYYIQCGFDNLHGLHNIGNLPPWTCQWTIHTYMCTCVQCCYMKWIIKGTNPIIFSTDMTYRYPNQPCCLELQLGVWSNRCLEHK